MGIRIAILVALAVGCTKSNSIECGSVICSENSVCNPAGDGCVLQTQVDACQGKVDDDGCSYLGASTSVCVSGVCTEIGCGNHHIDKQLGEVCDDGNRISGDGCSDDCKSTELCGDSIVDLARGEECDAGAMNSDAFGTPCHANCKRPRCGDKIRDPGEACDDGNNLPGDGCRADCAGRWTQMQSNTVTNLKSVWALSSGEAWAVGDQNHVMHYDGMTWSQITGPPSPMAAPQLSLVWAASPTAVFVVESINGTGSPVYRFDGTTWTGPYALVGNFAISAITGTSANDVFLIGNVSNSPKIARFNGTAWSYPSLPTTTSPLRQAYEAPTGELFVTDGAQLLHRYVGTTWTDPVPASNPAADFVAGSAANDVTVFSTIQAPFGAKHGTALSSWTAVTNSAELTNTVAGLAAVPGQQIAISGTGGTLICDGSSCVLEAPPFPVDLNGVAAYAKDRAYLVGTRGTILY